MYNAYSGLMKSMMSS